MRVRTKIIIPLVIAAVILSIVGFAGVTMLWAISKENREPIPSYEEISDDELVNRTKDLPEVKAFLARYPTAWIFVERASDFAVHHQITHKDLTGRQYNGTEHIQPYLSLNVELDSKGYPDRIVLWCTTDEHGQFKIIISNQNDLIENLDKEICKIQSG